MWKQVRKSSGGFLLADSIKYGTKPPSCGQVITLQVLFNTSMSLIAFPTEMVNGCVKTELIERHYNYTGKFNRRGKTTDGLDLTTVAFLIICSFIVLENLMVLLAIWKNNKFHNRMYYFIGNLALSDLLAGIAYKVNILMSGKKTYGLTPTVWFIREGSMFVALGASTFSLLAIAIERHMTMIKMRPYDSSKKHRVFLLIGACWLIAILFGVLPILGWNCICNFPDCSTVLPLYSKHYIFFSIGIFSAILLAIVILYARIYILVKSSSRNVANRKFPKNNSERSMALLRTVVIVVGVFIACWSPLFILLLLDVACKPNKCSILYQEDWFIAIAVLNSGMNPIIYTLASKEMRRAFFRLLCGCLANDKVSKALPIQSAADNSKSKTSGSNMQKSKGEPIEISNHLNEIKTINLSTSIGDLWPLIANLLQYSIAFSLISLQHYFYNLLIPCTKDLSFLSLWTLKKNGHQRILISATKIPNQSCLQSTHTSYNVQRTLSIFCIRCYESSMLTISVAVKILVLIQEFFFF